MADQNTVPNSGVVSMGSRSSGDETEALTSLSSVGSGHPRGVTENGTPIPPGQSQNNGVRMPGPMSAGYENGWFFNDDGDDPSGITNYSGYIQGVQLNGGPNEQGWGYGQDYSNLAPLQQYPTSNQNFGVLEGNGGAVWDGDDAMFGQTHGRMPANNYDMVQPGDIMAVFSAVTSDGGQGAHTPSGPVPGQDSMNGIVLGPGSGPYTGGEQNTYDTSNRGEPR